MMTGSAVQLSESCCKAAVIIANLCTTLAELADLQPVSAARAFLQKAKSATVFDSVAGHLNHGTKG